MLTTKADYLFLKKNKKYVNYTSIEKKKHSGEKLQALAKRNKQKGQTVTQLIGHLQKI